MPHIRILRHYFHTPHLVMAVFEFLLITGVAYHGYFARFQALPPDPLSYLLNAVSFSLVLVVAMMAMGVYESKLREGYTGMMLRTAVSIFLLGTMGTAVVSFLFPSLEMGRGVLLFSTVGAFVVVAISRWLTSHLIDEDLLKKRVLVLGAGNRSLKIATRMRRRSDRRAFVLVGFLQQEGSQDLVTAHGAKVITTDDSLMEFCEKQHIGTSQRCI